MKKILAIAVFLFSFAISKAQLSYGLTAGINLASYKESALGISVTSSNRTSFILGGFIDYELQEGFSILSGLQLAGMGGSYSGEVFKLNYLQLPVLAKYNVTDNIYVNAGTQLGILVSAKVGEIDVKTDFIATDLHLVGGGGIDITDNIGAQIRYGFSLGNVAAEAASGVTSKNRFLSIGLNYKF
jgi:hypothetical protein